MLDNLLPQRGSNSRGGREGSSIEGGVAPVAVIFTVGGGIF